MSSTFLRPLRVVLALGFFVAPTVVPVGLVHAEGGTVVSESEREARSEFEAGRDAYDHGATAKALTHFERAYALSKRPALLFNIARASDAEGLAARAAAAYEAYLDALPNAENRDFVASRLEKMRASIAAGEAEQRLGTQAPDAPDPPGYRELVDEALREYDAGNFHEARALFVRAHEKLPNARTLRGIGKAEFELRNYPASLAALESALRSPMRPLDGKLRVDAEQLLARARSFVGELKVEARPAYTELLLDGVPTTLSADQRLFVKMGEHVLDARAPGHLPEKRRLTVRGGETETVVILFRPTAEPVAERGSARGWYKSPWLWGGIGAVLVGGVTAGALAARGREPQRVDADAHAVTR